MNLYISITNACMRGTSLKTLTTVAHSSRHCQCAPWMSSYLVDRTWVTNFDCGYPPRSKRYTRVVRKPSHLRAGPPWFTKKRKMTYVTKPQPKSPCGREMHASQEGSLSSDASIAQVISRSLKGGRFARGARPVQAACEGRGAADQLGHQKAGTLMMTPILLQWPSCYCRPRPSISRD